MTVAGKVLCLVACVCNFVISFVMKITGKWMVTAAVTKLLALITSGFVITT